MVPPSVSQRIEHVTAVRKRGRHAMAVVLVAAAVAVVADAAAPWVSLDIAARLLVLGCSAVCVFTAISDERAWRGVEVVTSPLGTGIRASPTRNPKIGAAAPPAATCSLTR